MKIISQKQIRELNISPASCVEWVKESFSLKKAAQLPAKISLLCEDDNLYREGCLVVPVHTRGFQNCDLFFDKVYADDTAHVCGFKYFSKFKQFGEIQDIIDGKIRGRVSDKERILSYNIGLGLHDIVYASKIYEILKDNAIEIKIEHETEKF